MCDGPGLYNRYTGCSGIGINGDQLYSAGCRASQGGLSIIHNIGGQRTEGLTSRVDESQNYLVTAQGRKGVCVTELVGESEIRREIARHWKAANCVVSRVGRLGSCLVVRHREAPDSPDSPNNYHEC